MPPAGPRRSTPAGADENAGETAAGTTATRSDRSGCAPGNAARIQRAQRRCGDPPGRTATGHRDGSRPALPPAPALRRPAPDGDDRRADGSSRRRAGQQPGRGSLDPGRAGLPAPDPADHRHRPRRHRRGRGGLVRPALHRAADRRRRPAGDQRAAQEARLRGGLRRPGVPARGRRGRPAPRRPDRPDLPADGRDRGPAAAPGDARGDRPGRAGLPRVPAGRPAPRGGPGRDRPGDRGRPLPGRPGGARRRRSGGSPSTSCSPSSWGWSAGGASASAPGPSR